MKDVVVDAFANSTFTAHQTASCQPGFFRHGRADKSTPVAKTQRQTLL